MLEAAGVPKQPAVLGGAAIAGFFASACRFVDSKDMLFDGSKS